MINEFRRMFLKKKSTYKSICGRAVSAFFYAFLSVLLLMFFSCSSGEPELVFAVGGAPSELDYWELLIREFNSEYGKNAVMLRQATDTDLRRESLAVPLRSGRNNPDIFLMDIAWIAQFAASQWLEPLDDYIEKDDYDTSVFFKNVLHQADIYREKLIALPVYIDCGLLYYRKDLLEKYDLKVPETWEELVDCSLNVMGSEKKHNSGFAGFIWQGAQYEGLVCSFIEFISANNGSIFSGSGETVLNSEENTEALRFMKDLIQRYGISPPNTYTEMKEEEVRTFFQNGNALFERNWPYAWQLHRSPDSKVRDVVGMALLPKFKGGTHSAALGGWHIAVSRYSDRKEDAWKLLKFILSGPVQKKLVMNLGWNSGRRDIYTDREVTEKIPELAGVLKEAFRYSAARPSLPFYTGISRILQKYVNRCLAGGMDPDEALRKSESEIKKIIERYREGN